MTGLKDRQRLALYVALGLSAGSGLMLDASTAYANPLDIPVDNAQYANGVDMGATNGNKLTIGATSGDTTDNATPMEHPVIGKDIIGGSGENAYANEIIIESIKAVDADYGRVYGAHAAGTVEGNSIKFNGGVVNELIGAESTSTGTAGTHGAQRNTVTVTGNGTVHGNVTGGIGGTYSSVNHNTVSISGSRIEGQVNGGAGGDNAVVTGNEVRISGGNLTTVNGGIGKNGSTVNDNTVTVTGGTFGTGSRIVGGETGATSTKSNANKIILGSEEGAYTADLAHTEIWGSRYDTVGVIAGSDVDERIKENTLTVNAQNVTVDKVRNFEKYKFNLNKGVARAASMLTVADADGFGTGANVQWNDIQLDVSGWEDKPTDLGSKYYGKNDLTLLKTSDNNRHLTIHNTKAESLTRTGVSGDFEYHLATDNSAAATAANGPVSVAKVTAAVNRVQNAKAFYDGENVDGHVVRGGYSEFSPAEKDKIYHVTNNRLTVSHLPTGGLDAAYGGEVAGLAGSVLENALYIRNTDDKTIPTPNHETLTNAYGGAITKSANAGDVKHNGVSVSGGKVQNAYGGYTVGNGTVADNRVFLRGGTVQNAYGGKSDRNGTVIDNVVSVMGGGTVSDAYGAYASGAAALTHNSVLIDGGTAKGTTYGAKSTSGDVDKNEVFVRSGSAAHIVGADSATGKVSNSRVMIAGGTVGTAMTRGTITGAQSADGRVTDNGVTMTGGVLHANVYAAKTTGNGTAQRNFISLGDDDHRDLTATATTDFSNANLYGADLHSTATSSGNNDLKVYAKNVAVHLVSGFDNYRFDIARGITDGAKMLTVTQDGFGSAIDGRQIKIENKEKLMEKGNPGGRITLVQGNSLNPLKFTNNTNKRVDLTNQDGYKNIEYVLELSPDTLDETTEAGVSKAEALLLTYAKFKDNVWNYDATQDPSERNEIFGGISYYKNDTDNNNLTVDGIKKDLEAAYGGKTNGLANATNNHVVINRTNYNVPGLGKIKKVIGGYTQAPYTVSNNVETAGVAAENEAVVYDGTVSEGLYGGYTKGNKGKARSNKAIVGGGSVANVYGGIATENGGEATENKAEIYGGTVTNVYGGAVGKVDAAATKNKVQVRGGTVTGEIAGARAVYDTTPTATHTLSNGNNVMLGSEEPTRALDMNVAGASIYGTDYRDVTSGVAGTPELTFDSASDQIKDNELIVTTTGVSAKKVRNFDSYTFVLGDNFENKDTMLTLTEAGGFGTVSNAASNPAVKVDWGKVKANTSKLTDRRGGGIHGRNNFTLMQEAVPGTTISYPNDLAFANYTDTAGIAEIDRVYEKKMTADVAPAAGSTDTSANKVLLELNRFRNDEVTHKGTEAQAPTEVYGGYSGYDHTERDKDGHDITVGTTTESNILNIEGIANGTTLKAYGGYTGGAHGGSKDNTVHINLEELPGNVASGDLDSVYGGYAEGANAGAVSGNIVTFSQGATLHDLMGGYLKSTTSTSDVSGNKVFIAGGEFNNAVAMDPAPRIYGGATDGSGTATRNVLQITGGTIGNATHAADVVGGRSATGAAEENHVVLGAAEPGATPTAPALKGNVTGGYGATATDNTVEILAGTLTGSVYGGYATTAGTPATTGASPTAEVSALRNNKVTLRDGVTVTGNVYGGYAAADASNMTAATDSNTINLYKAVIGGTIYGGMAQDAAGRDVVSGKNNTLAVHGYDSKAGDFAGVQNLNFYLPEDVKNDPLNDVNAPTMLKLTNVTNVDANGKKDLSNIKVGVELDARRAVLHSGDNISLMTAYNANTPVELTPDHLIKALAEGHQDALRYKFELVTVPAADAVAVPTTTGGTAAVNNKLIAKVTEAALDPQTKSLVETRAASMAFINSGSDLLTDAAMTAAMEAAATPASESQAGRARVDGTPKEYGMWAVQNVSSMRLNSGSHVDAKGWGLNLGFAKQRVSGRNTLTYGPFVEYGKGSYDSYLDDGLHGSGDMDYLGVGVMAKSQSQNGAYVEGSVRVGRVKSDYAGTIADTHRTYDSSSTYYAGHLGVGQEKQLKNGNTIDTYAKYFFAHQGGDTVRLSNGAVYDFDAANSHRIRFGTRYTSKKGDASFYTGLAYEYEFGDDFAASYQGYNTPSPSLTGGTGILELGYRFTPQNGRATYGIQLMGMTGKRRGVSGGVQMHWAF
ncbi:autotransporter outer membrane beta-barrel domain-containing protein [Selenomonas sp. oral taxon 478]|uniref:autotransporter outer membrane beta-barrel domain-containing protein n=1 Tax=Selenomonas sp. oral taxon 478 TaxID=712538 RepID=UPI00067D5C17|nr:autotransporter outer membrane beta-barrel domain-containing protein [Selenomonas sp. oral taxon 478]